MPDPTAAPAMATPSFTTVAPWQQTLTDIYPALAAIGQAALERDVVPFAQHVTTPAHTTLFTEQAACPGFPFVLRGEVRVARQASDGRQLELYRVGPGDLCVISTCSLYGSIPLSAHGETVAPSELLLLTPTGFTALNQHAAFRRFIFGVFGDRLAELAALAEAVAFQRLDQRLAQALLGHGPARITTHQHLAHELGAVREAVTRLLRRFEQRGWVRLGRERIDVLDPAGLRRLAETGIPD